jgi:hypothetical protein
VREVFALGLAGLSVAVAGCSGSSDGGAAATPTVAASSPAARPTATPTSARRSPRPATVDAVCPYADATTIAETVGQRIARTTVTQTRPHVGCAYYRANGEQAVEIAVSTAVDPVTAQTRALAIAGPSANPVDDVGDGGAVTVTDAGSVLAVSAGTTIVVVRINQRVSLEAVEIARMVVARI